MNIVVHGEPAPQGSKRAYVNRHTGRAALVESSRKVKPWREAVKYAALDALAEDNDEQPLTGPVFVRVTFYLRRPRGHYGTGRNAGVVRVLAPALPATRVDLDKLVRASLDGLTDAGVWGDDGQVTGLIALKRYADDRPPGAVIVVIPELRGTVNGEASE